MLRRSNWDFRVKREVKLVFCETERLSPKGTYVLRSTVMNLSLTATLR